MKTFLTAFLIVLAFIGGCFFDGFITRVPPDASTVGRLMRLKRDIVNFYDKNKMLPESLVALGMSCPEIDKSHLKENAWGGPIFYSVSNGTFVVLKSYGPGGPAAEVKEIFTMTFDVTQK